MLYGEELRKLLDNKFLTENRGMGLEGFCSSLCFEDREMQSALLKKISKECDIIWYPGCGGDIFPCKVYNSKEFEIFNLKDAEDRVYLYTDPDFYGLCEEAFKEQKFRIRSLRDVLVENYSITELCIPLAKGKQIDGYYCNLTWENVKMDIIFLKIAMQDFLLSVIRRFKFPIKCVFYLNMESKGGTLFSLYEEYGIEYPQYLCADRTEKFGLDRYAKLQSMQDEVMMGPFIKRDIKKISNSNSIDKMQSFKLRKQIEIPIPDETNTKNQSIRVESNMKNMDLSEADLPFD